MVVKAMFCTYGVILIKKIFYRQMCMGDWVSFLSLCVAFVKHAEYACMSIFLHRFIIGMLSLVVCTYRENYVENHVYY